MPAPGLRLRGAVPPKEHNHEVSGNSDTDRVRNLDLPTSTGSTIAAALGTPLTDSVEKTSLLDPTSPQTGPGLS